MKPITPPDAPAGDAVSHSISPRKLHYFKEQCDTRSLWLSGRKAQASVRSLFPTPACAAGNGGV
jgi:hypothetical protein